MPLVKKLAVGTVQSRTVPKNRKQRRRKKNIPSFIRPPSKRNPRRGFRPSHFTRTSDQNKIIKEIKKVEQTYAVNSVGSQQDGPKYFIAANILGAKIDMLLDSGSQVTIQSRLLS